MRFALTLCCALFLVCLSTQPVLAAWSPFISLGSTTVNSDPSCAAMPGGIVVCSARSFANTLMVNKFDGSTWTGWTKLAGAVTSAPSCTSDGVSKVICAARATNGGMVYTIFDGAIWTKEVKLKGQLDSGPSCANFHSGRVLCAARSATGGLT